MERDKFIYRFFIIVIFIISMLLMIIRGLCFLGFY